MEVEGSVRLSSWICLYFILLFSGMVEMKTKEIYSAPGREQFLNVQDCTREGSETLEWIREGKTKVRLVKWKESQSNDPECENVCELHQNGFLLLKKPKEEDTKYTVTVRKSTGQQKCTETVQVIIEEMLKGPDLNLTCSSAGAKIHCSTGARGSASLTLTWGGKSKTSSEKSIEERTNQKSLEVSCVSSNHVSHGNTTKSISCTGLSGWNVYIIASVAGGAVFLVIFVALIIWTVKYKPWRSRGAEDEEMNRPATHLRQGPQSPHNPGYLSGGGGGDDTPERGPIQSPPTPPRQESQEPGPGSRKGKQNRGRRPPPPQTPGEAPTTYAPVPGAPKTAPALPGNHPNDQAPRPQPRTKSKPPRQKRRQERQ